jgi:uncharacterized protein YjbI with pentapeptide repeats
MKADELQELSKKRSYRGKNLQGQSFKGKNLSQVDFREADIRGVNFTDAVLEGADFTKADIRGVNFTDAILEGVDFTKAKAGLQKRWILGQGITALFICFVLGIVSSFCGYFVGLYSSVTHIERLLLGKFNPIPGIFSVLIVILVSIMIVRHGLTASAVREAMSCTIIIAVLAIGAFPLTGTLTIAGVGAGMGAVAVAVIGSVPIAVVGIRAFTVTIVIALFGAITSIPIIKSAMNNGGGNRLEGIAAIIFATAVAFTVLFVSFYMTWRAFQEDEKFVLIRKIQVWVGAIGGTNFHKANLTNANFTDATLTKTNFSDAKVIRTRWLNAKQMDQARWGGTILIDQDVRELLCSGYGRRGNYSRRNLQGAYLALADLSEANLSEANISDCYLKGARLEGANLSEANISGCYLKGARLEGANLIKTQALGVDFYDATLSGACIEAWNIDSTTKLEGVNCTHIYLKYGGKERRPHSDNEEYAPGDFTKLFQETLDTVDIIFKEGLDWKNFIIALDKVQVENEGIQLSVESVKQKEDGFFVVRVTVPPDADKVKLNDELKRVYKECESLKAKHKVEVKRLEERHDSTVKILASNRNEYINGDKIMGDKHMYQKTKNINFNAPVTNFVDNIEGNQNNFFSEQPQTLAEAAQEIQQLLKQLEVVNAPTTVEEKQAVVNQVIEKIYENPTLKSRVFGALKAAGTEAFKEAVDHPLVNILVATIEGWRES